LKTPFRPNALVSPATLLPPIFRLPNLSVLIPILILTACSSKGTDTQVPQSGGTPRRDSSGFCEGICDASPPSVPVLNDTGGFGDVTTYGSLADPAPSRGGACNYGSTEILRFAAIQVSLLPGDLRGQWQDGRICGRCAEVRARTPDGWKTTVVRIMDKCPDANCGIDLGGLPAQDLMGARPGRYSGEWRWVSCAGHEGVSDGPPSLFVKEGGNAYWSLVQVRNAEAGVLGVRLRLASSGAGSWTDLPWATEAENFFKVPTAILQDAREYDMEILLSTGRGYGAVLKGADLAAEKSSLALEILP
jgi:hypothetical protein